MPVVEHSNVAAHSSQGATGPMHAGLAGTTAPVESGSETAEALRAAQVRLARSVKEVELLTMLLDGAERERDACRAGLASASTELLTMQHDRNCQAIEAERLRLALQAAEQALQLRSEQVSALISSLSWRVTGPLRALRRWLSR